MRPLTNLVSHALSSMAADMTSVGSRKIMVFGLLISTIGSTGCWEQVSEEWFPQMKRQLAIQAFEENTLNADQRHMSPPEGTVPVGWGKVAQPATMSAEEQEALVNPREATLESLKNGEAAFQATCAACHGPTGGGDGPIASPRGPIAGVLPIGPGPMGFSLATGLTDGHIYTTISLGRGRMPNYRRFSPETRWDIVNYIRDLNGQGGQ